MKTTTSRILATAAAILILALILIGASFHLLIDDYLTEQSRESLRQQTAATAELAAAHASSHTLDDWEFVVDMRKVHQLVGADILLCDPAGTILVCVEESADCGHEGYPLPRDLLEAFAAQGVLSATGTIERLYPEARNLSAAAVYDSVSGELVGYLMLSRPQSSTTLVMSKISNIFLMVSMMIIMVAVVAMSILARQQTEPLRQMTQTAIAFGHGDLTARVRIDEGYPEDVEELARAFNNMARTLQHSEYQRQEFVANVSHELKTPMTTIAGYIDGILDGTIPRERHRHYLQIVSEETKRLSRLVRSMLDISKLQDQGGIPEERKIHFDMEECAGQVLITFEQKITAKNLDVEVDMPEHPMYTNADPDAVTQVIYNLIDNAVKFCPQGGTLGLKIQEGGGKIYTSISNSGDTIPPEELPLVFDRFHKLDKSRSKNRDGWGLGLYIVKTIVCSHGEDISVASQNGRTTFTFTMPLVN